jgi:hypothetical protein
MLKLSIKQIEEVIREAEPEEQQQILARLPRALHISLSDLALLKLSEGSFDFWNNPDDAVYDKL